MPVGSKTTFMQVEEANSESDDLEDNESVFQRVSVQDEGDAMYDYEQEDSVQMLSASDATSMKRDEQITETSISESQFERIE